MRILVIDLLNIGDVLFTTPALASLKAAFPDAEIDILVKHIVKDVVIHNPNLTNTFPMDINGYHKKPKHFLELIRKLRRRRYDTVIDLHGCARTGLITLLCGAKERLGLVSKGYRTIMHHSTTQRVDVHRVESYLEILRNLQIPVNNPPTKMQMTVDTASQEHADNMWQQAGLCGSDTVIGINPGASVPKKRWPQEYFAELADTLHKRGYKTVIFGGPTEVGLVDGITSAMQTKATVFTGKLTLLELAAMIAKCTVFVTTDTGPMHIAASQCTPIVAILGPGNQNPIEFGPYGVTHIALSSDHHCDGCAEGSDDLSKHTCMFSIGVDRVLDATMQLLGK